MDNKDILNNRDPAEIIEDFKGLLDDIEVLDFSNLNFEKIYSLLESGPAKRYLPPPDEDYLKKLPPKNSNDEYVYEKDGKAIIIPQKFSILTEYTFRTWGNCALLPEKNIFEILWEYIVSIIRWTFTTKKRMTDQLKSILCNVDEYYQNYRNKIKNLGNEYDDDTFEILHLLPDLFLYLCRLIADTEIPKEYKVELALALIYLISPIDFIPEGLIHHPIAFADDVGIILFVIKRGFDGKYVSRDKLETHWPGNISLIDNLGEWVQVIENVIGKDFIETILSFLKLKRFSNM